MITQGSSNDVRIHGYPLPKDDPVERERLAQFMVIIPFFGHPEHKDAMGGKLAREVQLRFGMRGETYDSDGRLCIPVEE